MWVFAWGLANDYDAHKKYENIISLCQSLKNLERRSK